MLSSGDEIVGCQDASGIGETGLLECSVSCRWLWHHAANLAIVHCESCALFSPRLCWSEHCHCMGKNTVRTTPKDGP